MKPTRTSAFLILLSMTSSIFAIEEGSFKNYFKKSLEQEKVYFLECLKQEGLELEDQVNTKCTISKLFEQAYFLLNNEWPKNSINQIPNYVRFEKTSYKSPIFPSHMNVKGLQGYVLVNYDINKMGLVENVKAINGFCGNIISPFAEFKTCNGFNISALRSAQTFVYKPAHFDGRPIRVNNVQHKFTFILSEPEPVHIDRSDRAASKRSQKELDAGNYQGAFIEATKLETNHRKLDFLAAKAKFYMQDYVASSKYMNQFITKSKISSGQYPEPMMVESLSILIASLFNQNKFNEIIEHEKTYSLYLKERDGYKEILTTTNLYIGIAFINTGNLQDGIFYLGMASKHSDSQIQKDYILNLYNQVSNYL